MLACVKKRVFFRRVKKRVGAIELCILVKFLLLILGNPSLFIILLVVKIIYIYGIFYLFYYNTVVIDNLYSLSTLDKTCEFADMFPYPYNFPLNEEALHESLTY